MSKQYEHSGYEYKSVNITLTPYEALKDPTLPSLEEAANYWASQGWRTVSVIPPQRSGYAFMLLVERPLKTSPSYVVGKNVDHNHPRGTGCGDDCPVLIQWSNLGGAKGSRG